MINTDMDTVYHLAARGNRLFAARRSGLSLSDDGGLSWRGAFDSLGSDIPPATAVAVAPDGSDVFAAAPGAILRSSDGGENWQVARLPSPPPFVTTLVVSPNYAEDGTVFAGTAEDGVFRSDDRGRLWSSWNFGLLDMQVLTMAASPNYAQDETLYAGVESGIFRSTNGGRAWRDHQINFPLDYAPVLSLATTPAGVIFAGTEAHGLHCSDDRGRTWTQAAYIDSPMNALVVQESSVWVLLSDGLVVSRDAGETWAPQPITIEQPMTALLVNGDQLIIGLANGELVRV